MTIEEKRKRAPRNALTFKKRLRLANWIEKNIDYLLEQRPTYEDAALEAADRLGFSISEANIRGLAKELDLLWSTRAQTEAVAKDGKLVQVLAHTLVGILRDLVSSTTTPELREKLEVHLDVILSLELNGRSPGPSGVNPLEGRMNNGDSN